MRLISLNQHTMSLQYTLSIALQSLCRVPFHPVLFFYFNFFFFLGASIPPPGTPTIQTVNISAVLITWTYPPNLPSPVYFYVQCSIDGDPFANVSGLVPYTSGVTPSYVYRGLLFQAFYQFQVLASYAGESSNPSGTSNAFINGVTGTRQRECI